MMPFLKYLCGDNESNYFSFSKKIHEKLFNEIQKKLFLNHQMPLREIKHTSNNMILNHLPGCLQLHSKKLLFLNLKRFYEK